MFLRALDEVSDTTIIARPKVMCPNRQKAEILVGRRVAYLSTTQTETTTTQTVEYLDTGIHLVFRPYISPDKMARLEPIHVRPSAQQRTVADVNGNPVSIPDEVTSEVFTNIRVRDGETPFLAVFSGRSRSSSVIRCSCLGILVMWSGIHRSGRLDSSRGDHIHADSDGRPGRATLGRGA